MKHLDLSCLTKSHALRMLKLTWYPIILAISLMIAKLRPLLLAIKLATFSMRHSFGCLIAATTKNCQNTDALLSRRPSLSPILLNGAQFSPPYKTSWSGIELGSSLVKSPECFTLHFRLRAAMLALRLSISEKPTHRRPAAFKTAPDDPEPAAAS